MRGVESQDERQRWQALQRLEQRLELPMVVLGLVWLVLLVIELAHGASPWLLRAGTAIWVVFIADFLLRLVLAPRKLAYLRGNLLTIAALLVPALRVFRVARALRVLRSLRAVRGVRLLRVVTSFNRAMHALAQGLGRHGFGYAAALTLLVLLAGAAGMYAFEAVDSGGTLDSYAEALWWTAMLITTLGSDYWPVTPEGRVLCLLLSIYAMGVFGYIAATLASFFIGRNPGPDSAVEALRGEIAALRAEVRELRRE